MMSTFLRSADHGSGAPGLHGQRDTIVGAVPVQLNTSPYPEPETCTHVEPAGQHA